MESLLTIRELSDLLRLSRSQCYELKEKIGYLKVGGAVRFRREDVVRFLEGCERNGNGERKPRHRFKSRHFA